MLCIVRVRSIANSVSLQLIALAGALTVSEKHPFTGRAYILRNEDGNVVGMLVGFDLKLLLEIKVEKYR